MSEESGNPDLVQAARQSLEALNRRDSDAYMSSSAPDAVWDASALGFGAFEGVAAIRSLLADWFGSYEEYEISVEEIHDLGNGVVFSVALQRGRMAGSEGTVQERRCYTGLWEAGVISRVTAQADIDEARAAAERLAEERG